MKRIRTFIAALVVILTLIIGVLALFPENTRREWFQQIGLLPTDPPTAIATHLPDATIFFSVIATIAPSTKTATPVPLTTTSAPTATEKPQPTSTLTAIPPTATQLTSISQVVVIEISATPQPTTVDNPCLTTVESPSGIPNAILQVVRAQPTGPVSYSIQAGTQVLVKAKRGTTSTNAVYQIFDQNSIPIGWIDVEYLPHLSSACHV